MVVVLPLMTISGEEKTAALVLRCTWNVYVFYRLPSCAYTSAVIWCYAWDNYLHEMIECCDEEDENALRIELSGDDECSCCGLMPGP